jgi:hypothetical protein
MRMRSRIGWIAVGRGKKKSSKPRSEIYSLISRNKICLIISMSRYYAGGEIFVPESIRHLILKFWWSPAGMAISDFRDDCRFRLKAWRNDGGIV